MSEHKLLAAALFQLRVMLAPFGGPDAHPDIKAAERVAYALHNEALAVLQGKTFDCDRALTRVERLVGGEEGQRVADYIRSEISN